MQTGMYVVARWIDDETGVTSIEYALLGALIAVTIAGTIGSLGGTLGDLYQNVASLIAAATQ